jgi:hypothetical protein
VSKVIVDLPPHPIHLLVDPVGQLVMSRGLGAFGFLREHRERRFQSVRKVARWTPRFNFVS